MAVRAADGGLMATSTRSNYTVDSWLRHDGLEKAQPWTKPGEVSADGRMRCDSLGCIAAVNGIEVAFVQDERAFAEDCAGARCPRRVDHPRRKQCLRCAGGPAVGITQARNSGKVLVVAAH
jgi:hypothetical protein